MWREFFSFPSILNDSFERQVNGGGMARVYILPKIVMFFRGFLKESTRFFIAENKGNRYVSNDHSKLINWCRLLY